MTPDFMVKVSDGNNITARLRERLLLLRITDSVDQHSDFLELVLDDRDGKLATPLAGTNFDISLGYKEIQSLTPHGVYIYDETEFDLVSKRLSIRARATDFRNSFKAPKSRSFHARTLGQILATIASDNGYTLDIHSELDNLSIAHLDQLNESDLNLVNRLRAEYDVAFKIANGKLFFRPRGGGPRITIKPGDVNSGSVTLNERTSWGAVMAQYHDPDTAEMKTFQAGQDQPVLRMAKPRANLDEAKAAAKAAYKNQQRATGALNLSLPGRGDLTANGVIVMQDWREGINGEWLIQRVQHVLDSNGYRCDVEAEVSN